MDDQHAPRAGPADTPPTPGPDAAHAPSPEDEAATARPRDEAAAAPAGEQDAGAEAHEPDLQARIAELEDLRLRALADLENFRKRVDRTMERVIGEERAQVAAEWLPVLDNLDLALGHAGEDSGPLVEGIRAVRDQAVGVLSRLGFPRQDQVGMPFDPIHHEAVSTVVDADKPEGTVVRIVRPGYGDDHRQLRPASVVVATKED
jgi:molecular chaperone GrpE